MILSKDLQGSSYSYVEINLNNDDIDMQKMALLHCPQMIKNKMARPLKIVVNMQRDLFGGTNSLIASTGVLNLILNRT